MRRNNNNNKYLIFSLLLCQVQQHALTRSGLELEIITN